MRTLVLPTRLLAVAVLLFLGCPPPTASGTLELSPSALGLGVGEARVVTARVRAADGSTTLATGCAWASSDPAVASVAADSGSTATVTGVAAGRATVTCTVGTKEASLLVVVAATPVTLSRIDVTPAMPSLAKGTTLQLTATAVFSDGTTADVTAMATWASGDVAVASVTSAGLVTGAAAGAVEVTATSGATVGRVTVTVTAATLSALAVTPPAPSLATGTTLPLQATGTFSDGTTQDLTAQVTWASSAMAVATVSAAGVVTGVGAGTAMVSATQGSVTASVTVTVTDATLTALEVTPALPMVPRGLTRQLTATGRFSDNSTQDLTAQVTWSSSAAGVATVSSATGTEGLLTAVAQGTAEVSATLGAVTGSTTVTVTAATLTSLAVTPAAPSLARGRTLQLVATGTYSDSSTQVLTTQVTWASSDGAVAAISNASGTAGLATGQAAGTSTITATLGTVSGTTTLTVTAAELVSLAVTPAGASLAKGLSSQYVATGTYTDATTQVLTAQVTWSTGTPAVATISNASGSEGLLTAVTPGGSTVVATLGAVSGQTSVTVTVAALQSLAVTPATPSLAKGRTQQLTATGTYSDATTQDLTTQVTWDTSSSGVVTVSNASGSQGLATAVDVGAATVTATLGGVAGNTTVTVTPAVLVSIAVTPATPSVVQGLSRQFVATGTYSDATTQVLTTQVTWASADTGVATISNTAGTEGLAQGVAPGTSSISATQGTVTGSTTLTVTAPALVSIAVTPATPIIEVGGTQQFVATGTYDNATTQVLTTSVTWGSSTGAATISNTSGSQGLATGAGVGTSSITATLGTIVGNTTLTVTAASLVSIAVTPASPSVPRGLTQDFVATGTYSDASTAVITTSVTWASSDEAVATISNGAPTQGRATTLLQGTSTITATLGSISGNTTLTVIAPVLQSIALSPQNPSQPKGRTQAFTATGTYSDTTTQDVTATAFWASTATGIVGVDGGLAVAVDVGSATVSATVGSVTGSTGMTVTAAVLDSLAVTGRANLPLNAGGFFTATGTFSDATTQDVTSTVTWSTSDAGVATVGATGATAGAVQGAGAGTATITATQGAVSGALAVAVRPVNAPASVRCSTGLVISQLYVAGGGTGATYNKDFIELHNAGATSVALAGKSLQYAAVAGVNWSRFNLPAVTLAPGEYFLVGLAAGTNGAPLSMEDTTTSSLSLSGTGGKVALMDSTTTITAGTACPTTGFLDIVGYGGANCSTGTVIASAPANTSSLQRGVSGCRDTANNATDFADLAVTPRSKVAGPGLLCECTANESDAAYEVDYCNLQAPPTLTVTTGTVTPLVYSRVFQDTQTQPAGSDPTILAEHGYGPAGADPATTSGWSWWPTSFNTQYGNDDEYQGGFVAPAAGAWSYTSRYTLDGVNWTYCDLNGAGSNSGLTFEDTQLGPLTVNP